MTEYPLAVMRFPCGLELLGLPGSNVEARFLYHEIFEDELYSRHGIDIQDGDTVLDVGANIGMFSTWLLRKFPNLKLLAFEPVPPIFQAMQTNLEALKLADSGNVQLFPCGLSNAPGTREITFYPTSPANSTLFPDDKFEEASVTVDAIKVRDVWKYDKLGFLGLLLLYPLRKKLIRDRMEKCTPMESHSNLGLKR
jgi:FkbM family methyltransferase